MKENELWILGISETKKIDLGSIKITDSFQGVKREMRGIVINKEILNHGEISSRIIRVTDYKYTRRLKERR